MTNSNRGNLKDFLVYVIDWKKLGTLIILVLVFILGVLVSCRVQMDKDLKRYEAEKAQLMAKHSLELDAVVKQAEAGIYASQYLSSDSREDILPLATWLTCLEGLYPGISPESKALACWVVFNRIDSPEYPNCTEEVLIQPYQFSEYNSGTTPTEQNYTIATNQISRWKNGDIRPCGERAIFITVSSEGVELRDNFEETRYTNYWRA